MDVLLDGIVQAFWLIIRGDSEIGRVAVLSLLVSGAATISGVAVGVPIGSALAWSRFRGRRVIISLVNTGMALPPVVVGLVVALLLWRSGPLGSLHLLYTPWAMVVAQFILSLPLVVGISLAAMQQIDPRMHLQLAALGASRIQAFWVLVRETRAGLLAAVMAGFGAAVSEVGASMIVGGNIRGETRVLTTAVVMETSKGDFPLAIAFGILLMALVYLAILSLTLLQQRTRSS
ncbi:MAG: ABC transporter permease [Chloroflexota bacterium]|mgnify:CR=1 FL=1